MTDLDPPLPDLADLAAVRAALDEVDDALHAALRRRAAIVAALAASRAKPGPPLRAGREAAILRRLVARHAGPLPTPHLVRFWREIMVSSVAMQSDATGFIVAVRGDEAADIARWHFGPLARYEAFPHAGRAIEALDERDVDAIAFLSPADEAPEEAGSQPWWTLVRAGEMFVVARLPILANPAGPDVHVVAAVPPDPSGQDHSLVRIEAPGTPSRASVSAAFTAAGLPPLELHVHREDGRTLALALVAGFVEATDPRLARLPFPGAVLLGAFADPIDPPRP
jgi:chorismate mutase